LGILFVLTSLPFIKVENFFSLFENPFIQFVSVLFSEANLVFVIGLTLGVFILAIGIGLKFFNLGMFFMKISQKNEIESIKKNNLKKQLKEKN